MIGRRRFLGQGAALAAGLTLAWPARASGARTDPRLVLVVLRGGLDGLAAVPVPGDRHYAGARGELALPPPGESGGALPLDGFFALHPSLAAVHTMYRAGEAAVVHAVAPPYRGRSHFAGQDVLETGVGDPSALTAGWLYRALATLPGAAEPARRVMAVAASTPRVVRGDAPVGAWSPDRLPEPDDDTLARVLSLYAGDAVLAPAARTMAETGALVEDVDAHARRGGGVGVLAAAAARFLVEPDGPRIAVLEAGGWDTHANQGAASGQLANRLAALDRALGGLRDELGSVWRDTVVVLVTEFGRTVAMNGTRGSDHGVGGCAFVLGGAVAGGLVIADWPGLARRALYDGRDLNATLDVRALFADVLVQHLSADPGRIAGQVFPGARLAPLPGPALVRA